MDTNQAQREKTPTGIAASGESRAIGESATETAFVSVYDAALMGVSLMAGPITPRCNCTWKCRLYPWCDLDKHLGGQPRPTYDGGSDATINGRATHESGTMNIDPANIVTAIATALTALVVFLDYRSRAKAQTPKLRLVRVDAPEDGWHLVFMRVYPGTEPVKFVLITASKAHLALHGTRFDDTVGCAVSHRVASPDSRELAVAVQVEASGEGAKPVEVWLYVKFTSAKSTRISLKSERRFLDVRYTITTEVSSST